MWRAVGDGFTGASPAAPRRAAMAASALRFFTLWRRHDRQRTEPPDSRSAPHGADSTVWAPLPFWASRASVASAGASRAGSGVLRRPASLQMVRRLAAERSAGGRGDERDQDKRERKDEGLSNAAPRRRAWSGVGCRRVYYKSESVDMSHWC